jgi:carbamoyl-phosphate synthase large subunit
MGGQTALNCALDLADHGVLEKHGVELIGAKREAIMMAEDRELFRVAMAEIGLECPKAEVAKNFDQAVDIQSRVGYPTIIRPSFTLGGSGGGIAYNREEFEEIVKRGLELSPVHEVLVEESVLGWKEFEMEVVRDTADNCIIVCSIENLDPMGVHTGDSITVAPAQTLTDKEYQRLRDASIAVLRKIGVDTGGSNVQFGVNAQTGRVVVIEMNPRVSRSSALASKATGFPIAKVAAKLAVGYTLDELKNEITGGKTPASFEPAIDYVVTKIPRFAFEKFPAADARLTTQMKSVGEVMAMGRTFQESLQKALRGLETGKVGLDPTGLDLGSEDDLARLRREVKEAGPERLLYLADAFRAGMDVEEVHALSFVDPWFLDQIEELVATEREVAKAGMDSLDAARLRRLKRMGFSDARLAQLVGSDEQALRALRRAHGIRPVYKRVDSCAGEFATSTAYMYSTYEDECEAEPTTRDKIMVLGGGPNRIGQGIEFDYCCVHAALALREDGFETIMVNCNPETVSTDYDTSDRLYFESLTLEDVLEIVELEKPKGVIVQYGGQTPLKLARALEANGVPIIGTSPDSIDLAEDRERFQQLVDKLGLKQPPNRIARNAELRARRPCDGGGAFRCRPGALHPRRGQGLGKVAGAARPLPRQRGRGRRRRHRRQGRAGADRRGDGTHRGGRCALRRLVLLSAAVLPERRRAGDAARTGGGAGARAQRGRSYEHPVRRAGRWRWRGGGLPAGGQPARLAHRALRVQGHRAAAGQDRRTLHGRAEAGRPAWRGRPAAARSGAHLLQHQGSGVPLQQVPGCGPHSRARDAQHW